MLLAGLVREQVLARTREQLPPVVDVEIESTTQPRDHLIRIDAPVLVETKSRQAILIGVGGRMTGSIGVAARHQSTASWRAVRDELSVRVRRRWRAVERVLDRLGIEQMVLELSSTGRPR